MPADDQDGEDAYGHQVEATWQERDEMAEGVRICWEEEGADPLLSTLARLREQRLRLEADMRLLIAYGRCFTHPRPYKLIDLANAAGMSISGVRTAYDTDEIDQAAEILQRPSAGQLGPAGNDPSRRRNSGTTTGARPSPR
jgi:hypothetical protein